MADDIFEVTVEPEESLELDGDGDSPTAIKQKIWKIDEILRRRKKAFSSEGSNRTEVQTITQSPPKDGHGIDVGTLTPSHWTSEAIEQEIVALKQQVYGLRDQLQRCYEIEAHSHNYIGVLKCRCRNVEETVERIREVESENRKLKRQLEYGYDDSVVQARKIEFLEKKSQILLEEKEALISECSDLRKQREKAEQALVVHEKMISKAYRQKLEEEIETFETQFKSEAKKSDLCSECLACTSAGVPRAEIKAPSMDSRVILMNPSHPAYEQLRQTSFKDLRKGPVQEQNTIKLDERIEFTYYAEPLLPVRDDSSKSKRPKRQAPEQTTDVNGVKEQFESLNKFRKVTIKQLKKS